MRVLLVSHAFHDFSTAHRRALQALGVHVDVINVYGYESVRDKLRRTLTDRTKGGLRAHEMKRVKRAKRSLRPDFTLFLVGDLVPPEWVDGPEAEKIGLWLYDDLDTFPLRLDVEQKLRRIATYSVADHARLDRPERPCLLLRQGFDSYMPAAEGRQVRGVLVLGAPYPSRLQAVTSLLEAGVPVTLVGQHWHHHVAPHSSSDLVPHDVSRATAHAWSSGALSLNVLRRADSGMNPRTFEIPGAGGVQLADFPEIASCFEPGFEVLLAETKAHLVELASRALSDDAWAVRIAEKGRARALAEHTLRHRYQRMLSEWGLLST